MASYDAVTTQQQNLCIALLKT